MPENREGLEQGATEGGDELITVSVRQLREAIEGEVLEDEWAIWPVDSKDDS